MASEKSIYKWVNTDARTVGYAMFNSHEGESGSYDIKKVVPTSKRHIMSFDSLTDIGGMPYRCNNIVDPPVLLEQRNIQQTLEPFTNQAEKGKSIYVGYNYVNDIIMKGQYISLVPLDLKVGFSDAVTMGSSVLKSKGFMGGTNRIDSFLNRLNVTSYGYSAVVNTAKYRKAVGQHMKVCALSLGIDYSRMSSNDPFNDSHFYQNIIGDNKFIVEKGKNTDEESVTTIPSFDEISASIKGMLNGYSTIGGDDIQSEENLNMLKYILNVDDSGDMRDIPIVTFYANGPINNNITTQSDVEESAYARAFTDVGLKALDEVTDKVGLGDSADNLIKELAYHNSLLGKGKSLLTQTKIPKMISGMMADESLTFSIRSMSVDSSPYGILHMMSDYVKLLPFITEVNDKSSALIVPHSPMYCSVFSKGVANYPRAIVSSVAVTRDSTYQTPQGIPVEMTLDVTITPLINTQTMPDYNGLFTVSLKEATSAPASNDATYLLASLFNPTSTLNKLATMCGQNTIMTKSQVGLVSYIIDGKVSQYIKTIGNVGDYAGVAIKDFLSKFAISGGNYSRILK